MKSNWRVKNQLIDIAKLDQYNYNDSFKRILACRFNTIDEIDTFLNAKLEDFKLYDALNAAQLIIKSINANQPIIIHGDYDADGICATSIIFDYIYFELGYKKILPYIPSRIDEGYGLTKESLSSIKDLSNKNFGDERVLIITVDCGVKSVKLVDEWKNIFDFIITDHHGFHTEDDKIFYPNALCIVHPKHEKSKMKVNDICGTAVIYHVVEEINKTFRINIDKYKPYLALATTTDVMPMIGNNRHYIINGLNNFADKCSVGLQSLCKVSQIYTNPTSFHLGYILGPKINASGRIGNPLDCVRLLTTRNEVLANEISQKLHELNIKRKDITDKRMVEARNQLDDSPINFIVGEGWEEGIIGLIAGKLSEYNKKPTFVFSVKDGHAVGSVRSQFVDVNEMFNSIAEELERYGGHKKAGGLALKPKNLQRVKKILNEYCKNINIQNQIDIDLEINQVDYDLFHELKLLEPFGEANTKPRLICTALTNATITKFGKNQNHCKIYCSNDRSKFSFIMWNQIIELELNKVFDVVFEVGEYNKFESNYDLYLLEIDITN